MSNSLEEKFHEEMLSVYKRAKIECNYNATRFLQLVSEKGGLKAAKTLLHSERYSEGFAKLCLLGRRDITMEAVVIQDSWSQLFTPDELATARKRLKEFDR